MPRTSPVNPNGKIGYAVITLTGYRHVGDSADETVSPRQAMRFPMRLAAAIHRFLDSRCACLSSATSQWYARQLAALAPLCARKLETLTPPDLEAQWLALTKKQNAGWSILAVRP